MLCIDGTNYNIYWWHTTGWPHSKKTPFVTSVDKMAVSCYLSISLKVWLCKMFRCRFSPARFDSNRWSNVFHRISWDCWSGDQNTCWPSSWALYIAAVGKAWSLLAYSAGSVRERYTTLKKHLLCWNYIYTFKWLRTFLKRVNKTLRQYFVPIIRQYKQYRFDVYWTVHHLDNWRITSN